MQCRGFCAKVEKLLMGSKMPGEEELPGPINILTLVDQLDKRIGGGVRHAYDFMSEFAHPNWSGVRGLFSRRIKRITLGATWATLMTSWSRWLPCWIG